MPRLPRIAVTTIADLLGAAADEWDGVAAVFPEGRATYPELEARAHDLARGLRGLGVGPGDAVAIFMPNCLDYMVALFAVAKLGAVSVPLNGRFKAFELGYVVAHCEARVLLVADLGPRQDEDFRVLAAIEVPPTLEHVVDLGRGVRPGVVSRAALAEAAGQVDPDEVALLQARVRVRQPATLMYTSGTTARPKGCVHTHESLVRQARMAQARAFQLAPGEGFWDALPLFHTGGVMPIMAVVSARASFCHAGHFEPGASIDLIERERCVLAYVMFDTIWLELVNHPRYGEEALGSLRTLYMVGVPERMRWYQERLPWGKVCSAFGMTECNAHLALAGPDADEETRLTTAGSVQPEMEAKIVDPETGAELGPNAEGELLYRGPCLFDGYLKEPELTAEAISPGGWFRSGDLGRFDEQGRFTFRGRVKDMLKVGGENVSALEVEGYLARHPAVGIVQVVAAPDARYAEVPCAFVQLAPGAAATEQELIDHCLGNIATFKVPRYVRFVTEWPMSGTKIRKVALREQIARELAEQGIAEAPKLERCREAARS